MHIRRWIVGAALAFLVVPGAEGRAQGSRGAGDPDSLRVDPRSPRAMLEEFFSLARDGQYEAAARFLGPRGTGESGALRARRLQAVLNRHLLIDFNLFSPHALGDTADGLPENRDQIGVVRTRVGALQPVQVERTAPGAEPAWVFYRTTADRIDEWYAALGDHWIRNQMPAALQRPGPLGIELWLWASLVIMLVVAIAIAWVVGRGVITLVRRAVRRTATMLDDRIIERTRVPLVALLTVFAYRALLETVDLSVAAERFVGASVRTASVVLITWIFIRATRVLEDELPSIAGHQPQLRAFAPLIGRVARIFLIALGAIAIVAQFGYSVGALLTGVGIGGIALAFAAQKTLEHPFGSVAIGLDQPIRVGDWVRIGDTEGEVESIGLRSTRLRTLARTVVVFPNGRLAEMPMENFGVRDRVLFRTEVRLTYDTTADQLRGIRDDIEHMLQEHPLVWPERIIVRLKAFGASSLDLDVIVWIATSDYNIFRAAREELLLRIMEIVAGAGARFALPTQTVHYVARAEDSPPPS